MAELLGLTVSLVLLLLILLPLSSFLRLARISRDLEQLRQRVAALERLAARREPAPSAGHEQAAASPAAHVPTPADVDDGWSRHGGTPSPAAPPVTAVASATVASLEARIGGRWLLYTGLLVLLLGVSFFLKYAFDNAWIGETVRALLGAAAGAALVVSGLRLARRGLTAYGQALAGTGFAILYLVSYAALSFYGLIDRGTALVSMAGITIGAAAAADRQRAQSLAFIAVAGGLLTPALVGGSRNAQLTLFTYDALLVGGTLVLSLRHRWLALNAVSYLGTLITIAAWAAAHYTTDQWFRTLLFLTLFCVLFVVMLRATRDATGALARAVRALIWTAPVLYHVAAVVITASHPPAIHVYLIVATAIGLWLTADPHRPVVRLAVMLAGFVPLFGTLTLPDEPSWLLPNLVTIAAVAALHLLALLDRSVRQREPLKGPDLLGFHVTGLGLFALLSEALQPAFPGLRGSLALALAAGAAALWRWLASRDAIASLNAAALALTLIAVGLTVQFDGHVVTIGWAVEGAAVAWLGMQAARNAFRVGGVVLWTLAALRLFETFADAPEGFTALFNARSSAAVLVIAAGYAIAWKSSTSTMGGAARLTAWLHVAAAVLTLAWITAEIQSFWDGRHGLPQAICSSR